MVGAGEDEGLALSAYLDRKYRADCRGLDVFTHTVLATCQYWSVTQVGNAAIGGSSVVYITVQCTAVQRVVR